VDFNCTPNSKCGGSTAAITFDGTSNFSTTSSLNRIHSQGPYPSGSPFRLTFGTSTGQIKVTDGTAANTLIGTILSFGVFNGAQPALTLHVDWNNLQPTIRGFLGTSTGVNSTVIQFSPSFVNNGSSQIAAVSQVKLAILPTPEPMSLALLGSGLIMVGGVLRRRLQK